MKKAFGVTKGIEEKIVPCFIIIIFVISLFLLLLRPINSNYFTIFVTFRYILQYDFYVISPRSLHNTLKITFFLFRPISFVIASLECMWKARNIKSFNLPAFSDRIAWWVNVGRWSCVGKIGQDHPPSIRCYLVEGKFNSKLILKVRN